MSPREASKGRARALIALAGLGLAAGGCRGRDDRRLDTIDVKPPIEIDISSDPRAPPPVPVLSGALPADFPDFPLHLPASIVDFGGGTDGRRSVSLACSEGPAPTLAAIRAGARSAGWSLDASEPLAGGGTADRWAKDGRGVTVFVEPGRPGTLYRIEY